MATSRLHGLLALGAGCFLTGAVGGWLLRGAPPSPATGFASVTHVVTVPASTPAATAADEEPEAIAGQESGAHVVETAVGFLTKVRSALYGIDEWDGLRRLHAIIDRLGPADSEAALAQVRWLPQSDRRQVALALGKRWAQFDPLAALAYAKGLGIADISRAVTDGALQQWATAAPAAMRAWLATLPAGEERNSAMARAVGKLGRNDIPAALELLDQLPEGRDRSDAIGDLLRNRNVTSDPQLSGKLYALLPSNGRNGWEMPLAFRMAQTDVKAAIAWASALPDIKGQQGAFAAIGKAWAQDDPAAALNWLLVNTPPTEKKNTLKEPFSVWAEAAPGEALAWALALPPGKNREDLAVEGIEHLAQTDPQRAAELIKTNFPAESRRSASTTLAVFWANTAPVAAAAWAVQLPEDATRIEVFGTVAQHWAMHDPAAAAAWMDRLPFGPARDKAISEFAYQVTDADTQGALAWAATISNANERHIALRNLAGRWKSGEPAAARQWITTTALLDPETKAALLRE